MSKLSPSVRHQLWLLLAAILAYWPVAFYQFGLKWDLIDVVFPFRYFFSESMQAGYFPFWNPYQQTGTPFFADLQAPTYYPELLLVSLLGGYRLLVMHLLLIGYFFIAGQGKLQVFCTILLPVFTYFLEGSFVLIFLVE